MFKALFIVLVVFTVLLFAFFAYMVVIDSKLERKIQDMGIRQNELSGELEAICRYIDKLQDEMRRMKQ